MWNWKYNKGKFSYEIVNEFPAIFKPDIVYIEGQKKQYWSAAFICPCGCRDVIYLNLLSNSNPAWTVRLHWHNCISIKPSVWRKVGCRSHFVLRKGKIRWCYYD